MKLLVLGLALLMSLETASGTEGFFLNDANAPSAVSAAWDSVFAFFGNDGNRVTVGTFSLIAKKTDGETTDLYFLGALHVSNPYCRPKCSGYLTSDLKFRGPSVKSRWWAPFTWFFPQSYVESASAEWHDIEQIEQFAQVDLAILKAVVPTYLTVDRPAIPISKTCKAYRSEMLYTVGFSATFIREHWKRGKPIDADVGRKRWSMGRMGLPLMLDRPPEHHYSYMTSVDMLPGGSGGPLLNASGDLIGVVADFNFAPGYEYASNEESFRRVVAQSASVTCRVVRAATSDLGL